ncbi:hypothetical protein V499_03001 [Pseudogymnoascus sp. VKM F-103]|nr:hypothetical protein V499_03001 [Pseudogymnoascus sp. VKM F-103]
MVSPALPVAEITTQLASSHLEKKEDATPLQLLEIPGYDQDLSWSIHEERVAVRKVDLCILTFIVLLFTFMQFDRTNISAALTDTLRTDINVNTSQINTAQTLFILGFILTEIPFNIITKKIGAETWLPITMFLWGVCTWCQIFMKSASGLFALRFFIGAMEGGYIPGMALYISRYYTNPELGLRFALFWASNAVAGSLSGPLSLGLLSLSGTHGLKGWQWLFLIEGAVTCFLAVVAYLYLPHSAPKPKSFFGKSWNIFTEREAAILTTRVLRDDATKGYTQGKSVQIQDLKDTFMDWKIYGHVVSAFLSMLMIYPINTYAPSLIKSLGFGGYNANGLNSVGSVVSLIISISIAWNSDRTQERGFHIAFGFCVGIAGLLWTALAPVSSSKWVVYGGIVLTQAGMGSTQALNAAWLSSVVDDRKRPIALAMYVMGIQLAGFPGNQLFRQQDAPRYSRGLIIAAACAAAGAVIVLVWKGIYAFVERRQNRSPVNVTESPRSEESAWGEKK